MARVQWEINSKLKDRFKSLCAIIGVSMQERAELLIKKDVKILERLVKEK